MGLAHAVLQQVDRWQEMNPKRARLQTLDERILFVPYNEAYADVFEDMRRRVPNTAKLNAYTGLMQYKTLQQTLEYVIEEFAAKTALAAAA